MKKIYLHIGTHKTGTSTIQMLLSRNQQELKQHSFYYDESACELGRTLMDYGLSDDGLEFNRCLFREKHNRVPEQNIVISGEGFFGNPFIGYKNISSVASQTKHILQDFDVELLVFFRSPDTFIESLYNQKIKEGSTISFQEFISQLDIYAYRWQDLIKSYEDLFGKDKIKTLLYEEGNVVKRFFEWLGIKLKSIALDPINRSLSPKGLEILKLCNPILEVCEQEEMRIFLQDKFAKQPYEPFNLFTDEQRKKLLSCYGYHPATSY